MGLSAESEGNALLQTATPALDYVLANYPSQRLLAAGTEVGLDNGEPGNSEVGHIAIGTGQVLPQAFQIINGSIKSGDFRRNRIIAAALRGILAQPNRTLHIVGLISSGGVHGHIDHMLSLLSWARDQGVQRVAVHAISDGRDSPPRVALSDAVKIESVLKRFPFGVMASISGRYFAMDRDNNTNRTQEAFSALTGRGRLRASTLELALKRAYVQGESDETVPPTILTDANDRPLAWIQPGETVIFTNYRPDRIRQLVALAVTNVNDLTVVTMTDYLLADLPLKAGNAIDVAYPLPKPRGTLADILADNGKSQLHIAETEKYAHVTYFFNGHLETKHPYEDWLLVPSIKVASFDQTPAMSASAITAGYLNAQKHLPADFVVMNYANLDMVGHTGNFAAACLAVSCVDEQLGQLITHAETNREWLVITADHGNVEQMIDPRSGTVDKEHTVNPVPFVVVHPSFRQPRAADKRQLALMSQVGMLADVAPTILAVMGLSPSVDMVGESLISGLIGAR